MTTGLDWLEEEVQSQKQEAAGSGGFKTVAECEISFCYQVFPSFDQIKYFSYRDQSSKELAKNKAYEYASQFPSAFDPNKTIKPRNGAMITIFADTILSATNLTQDWTQFVDSWQSKENWGSNPGFTNDFRISEEQAELLGETPLPYDAFMEPVIALHRSGKDVPLNKRGYCTLIQVVDGYTLARGKKQISKKEGDVDEQGNQKEYDYRIFILEDVHASKEEALKAVHTAETASPNTNGSVNPSTANSQLSPLAQENGWTLETLKSNAEMLFGEIKAAQEKIGGPPPLAASKAQESVANEWKITVDDLKLVSETLPSDVPF